MFDGNIEKELPISLFEEIEAKLCDRLLHKDGNQKKILNALTKVFTILLSVKADNAEKIIKIVKLSVSTVLKIWSEQN